MTIHEKKKAETHDDVLEAIAEAIDIPPSQYEAAVSRYESLGNWLDRNGSTIAQYDPEIAPQGSFLLGTVTRPLGDGEEYDVDLICVLKATKKDFTPKGLKEAVGHEVKLYAKAQSMSNRPEEGRRCWTLHYADDAQFHMDVLPSLPDAQTHQLLLERRGHTALAHDQSLTGQAIAITDWTLPQYELITEDWPVSNPLGYAAWFRGRMVAQLTEQKERYLKRQMVTASVDDIPDYKVKTPLQRAIQLLKRHRDSTFGDNEHKPISIIITTLSAKAYNEEASISEALQTILTMMDQFIEYRGDEAWVANPVNPEENFADKWAEEPQKRENFFEWLEQARRDFALYLRASPFDEFPGGLKEGLGGTTVDRALETILAAGASMIAAPAIAKVASTDAAQERAEAAIADIRESGSQSKPWAK
ncbi:nucleotidyltransferase [Nitratireductor sp. XY-223]|uniref:nucleotidyltransferase domain-containing protein n=1 Tax=Nitratireductor sp. XY-223 TaxID=2561926 RepID=UPI00197CBD75|nr:nucleotidyltransferase [Nitratireductor sp. XY-223]